MNPHKININGRNFIVLKSFGNKKYDVYEKIPKSAKIKHILSFGDQGYQHYFDKFGDYSYLDHNDPLRLKRFRDRFAALYDKNRDNPYSSIYWSWNYLW